MLRKENLAVFVCVPGEFRATMEHIMSNISYHLVYKEAPLVGLKYNCNPGAAVPSGGHVLSPLPYPVNALEPVIGSRTVRIHHDFHHKSYVKGLNRAELKLLEARKENNFELVKHWERELAFHGSGHILHSIYWTNMVPGGSKEPGVCTKDEINKYFGSHEAFRNQFSAAARSVEASGWSLLVWSPSFRHLEILTTEKHQNLTQWGSIPILVLDVWEHAYYLDYEYRRGDYVEDWWKLVNWDVLEIRLQMAMQGLVPLSMEEIASPAGRY